MVEYPEVIDHVDLPFDEPLGTAALPSSKSSASIPVEDRNESDSPKAIAILVEKQILIHLWKLMDSRVVGGDSDHGVRPDRSDRPAATG